MAIQGNNVLANVLNGADPPSQGSLVKKDDDGGFDRALGMALFAHPTFIPPPGQTTDAGRDRVAVPDQASSLAGPSPAGGNNTPRFVGYGIVQSFAQDLAIDNGDTSGPRSTANAATASFEDFAASVSGGGGAPSAARADTNQTPVIDPVSAGSPSPSATATVSFERFGGNAVSAAPADNPHGLPTSDLKPLDDSRGLPVGDPKPLDDSRGLPASDLKPLDDPRGLPASDPKPLDDPRGLPVGDPKPLFSQFDDHLLQSTSGGAAASGPREAGRVIGSKATGADSVLNSTGPAAPASRAQGRTLRAEGRAASALDGSQPKPAAARTDIPAGKKEMAATRLDGQPDAEASSNSAAPISEAQGKSAPSNRIPDSRIPDSIGPPNHPAPSDGDKRGPASRTDSAQPASHRSGADNGIASATASVSDTGTGAPRQAAGPAPTLRVIATPAPGAKVANLRIDLAAGQSTHATVRERSGLVDVRIVAASQQSAQLIGAEIPALRRALDAAGMQLKTADVRHQGGGGANGGHQGERQTERQWRPEQPENGSIFNIEEVKQ